MCVCSTCGITAEREMWLEYEYSSAFVSVLCSAGPIYFLLVFLKNQCCLLHV